MIQIEMLNVAGKAVQGLRIQEPGGNGHPNMLILLCEKGYIMCGYLNKEAADKFEDAAAVVGGSTFEEILANPDTVEQAVSDMKFDFRRIFKR